MTDTPVEEAAQPEDESVEASPEEKHCRWCGRPHEAVEDESDDWLCSECERYQDAMICPMCGNLARVSALPADQVPAPAKPKKAKKGE